MTSSNLQNPPSRSSLQGIAAYFIFIFVLTLPIWILSGTLSIELMPGLPIAAVAVIVPTISAVLAIGLSENWRAVGKLFASLVAMRRKWVWLIAVSCIIPVIAAIVSWIAVSMGGRGFTLISAPAIILQLLLLFVISAIAEELGWTAFATDRLRNLFGEPAAGLILGIAWSVWHYPALLEVGRSPVWIAGWTIWTIAMRVIMVRLYYVSDRWIWTAIVFHAMANLMWQLAPEGYLPWVEGIVMAMIAMIFLSPRKVRK